MSTATKERPILFSGEMVRAILDGRKTQTRRVIDRMVGFKCRQFSPSDTPGYDWNFRCQRGLWQDMDHAEVLSRCPFGAPGDRLWVREAWRCIRWEEGEPEIIEYRSDNAVLEIDNPDSGVGYDNWSERMAWDGAADLESAGYEVGSNDLFDGDNPDGPDYEGMRNSIRWRPSIHMPRWASRLLLEVTSVRVERLQDISYEDCITEVWDVACGQGADYWFHEPWESINGPGSWDQNPWVWVVEFKRAEGK